MGPPRKVLFPFLGTEMGGSHISAFTLAASLQADFAVECVVVAPENSLVLREAENLSLQALPSGERGAQRRPPLYDLAMTRRRLGLLRRTGAAVIHCNDIGTLQAWILPAKISDTPIIYHHRALNRMIPPNSTLLRLADHVVCISEECRSSVAFLPQAKVTTTLNPFSIDMKQDAAVLRRRLVEDLDLPPDSCLVGFIGNFWRRKRPEFFLEVCSHLARERDDLSFIVFGRDGELTQGDLERWANELGIADRTRFPGFRLPVEANVAPLDVLLLTAVREPFGRTAVESLLLGVPYIATADAGHVEIERRWKGGALVDPDASARTFARAVLGALDHPGMALPLAERQSVSDELSPRSHARKILDIYDTALKDAPSPTLHSTS